jgi:hypothetical protein
VASRAGGGGSLHTVIVAELEVYHSRPIAPTRRIALGERNLPIDPPPGAGGLLLAGIVAHAAPGVDGELREGLVDLILELQAGRRITQPRVRHRFQTDRVGLLRSTHRLVAVGQALDFEFDDGLGRPVQQALGAVYAAGSLPFEARQRVLDGIQLGLVWGGDVDQRFISAVMGGRSASMVALVAWNDPVAWALDFLGLSGESDDRPPRRVIQRQYRQMLREAHPDHGGGSEGAAQRISELAEARRILLAS